MFSYIHVPLLLLWICQSFASMKIGTLGVFIQTSEKEFLKIPIEIPDWYKKIRKM